MSITLKDLAALAKVHPSTVSRVLNNHSGSRISATTRQRILELIKETQYRPNRIARSLKLRQTEVLGVIIPDIANPFFAILFRGIEDVARSHSFNVILCNTDDQPGQERAYLQVLAERQIDGLIIATARRHDATILRLAKQGQPFVLVNRRVEGLTDRYVVADDVTGARLITQHLVQAGYRRIAHIAGPPRIMTAHSRALGYRKGLEECGLEYNPLFLVKGDFTEEAGYRAMRELLDLDEPPQAVFAVNDMAAIGAMSAVKERGLSVPEDVALAGYNDIPLASRIAPALTTVRAPLYDMGVAAAEMLIKQIMKKPLEPPRVVFEPTLVIRGSSVHSQERGYAGVGSARDR